MTPKLLEKLHGSWLSFIVFFKCISAQSLLLFILIVPLKIFGQNDYYATDTLKRVGINLQNGGDLVNAQFCRVDSSGTIIQFTAYEVSEYGFRDGVVYISKEIQINGTSKRVFLERLVEGKNTLYYYKGKHTRTFYIERDHSSLIEILKQDKNGIDFHRNLLNITSDCPKIMDAAQLTTYSKNPMAKFIEMYNGCTYESYPFFKYGIILGYGFSKLANSSSQTDNSLPSFNFKYSGGFTLGAFFDSPIYLSYFSLHVEAYYLKNGYSINQIIGNKEFDFVANTVSITLPVLIRYTYPSKRTKPYFNAGGLFNYLLRNDNALYESTINSGIIEFNGLNESSYISTKQIGFALGSGVEYKLDFKHSIFFELRMSKLYGISDSKSFNKSEINFFTGINF